MIHSASYNMTTSAFDVTEAEEHFTVDSTTGYASDDLVYDSNGNLTYDGLQSYSYDGWNRMKTVAHAYRALTADGGDGNVHSGQTLSATSYDAAGRRIVKAISNTGNLDCTYHYYLSGQSVVEERNGSDQPIKDHVWGLSYIDEALQTRINTDPTGTATWSSYWLMQDANSNVLGVVDSSGVLQERYEYTAYGQRQVFYSPGSNDPGCYAPVPISRRFVTTGSVIQPYGLCETGHQGLSHDEETGLVYNDARYVHPRLGRFLQNDPMGYHDGPNSQEYLGSNPITRADPTGLYYLDHVEGPFGPNWDPRKGACLLKFNKIYNPGWLDRSRIGSLFTDAMPYAISIYVNTGLTECECTKKGIKDAVDDGRMDQIMYVSGVAGGLEMVKQALHDNADVTMNGMLGEAGGPAVGMVIGKVGAKATNLEDMPMIGGSSGGPTAGKRFTDAQRAEDAGKPCSYCGRIQRKSRGCQIHVKPTILIRDLEEATTPPKTEFQLVRSVINRRVQKPLPNLPHGKLLKENNNELQTIVRWTNKGKVL